MNRSKAVIVVSIFAVLFAGIAAWLTYGYLQQEMSSVKAVQPQKIVVAAADIPIGATINQPHLKETSWPKDSIPPGSSPTTESLVGRIAVRPIAKGDAVTEAKLKPKAGATGTGFMTYVVPQGHRAVTVAVNEVAGVAGFITPNDRVDVVVTTQLPGTDGKENVSKIMLENIPILATGQITDQKEGKPVVVPTVTLDLIPEDAEKLVLSASKGTLQLLLRNITDSAPAQSRGATIAKVLQGVERIPAFTPIPSNGVRRPPVRTATLGKTRPVSVPKVRLSSHTVTIIDGGVRSKREFVLE